MLCTTNQRHWTCFSSPEVELSYEAKKNYLFDLSYLAFLDVEGNGACDFLQGQLSCDVREVTPSVMRQGALCNLQGRVLALMDVIYRTESEYHLILPADLLAATEASLSKAAMLSRVKLQSISEYKIFGFLLQNPLDILPVHPLLDLDVYGFIADEDSAYYSLGQGLYICLIKAEDEDAFCASFKMAHQRRGSLAWHALQLKRGHVEIYPESRGLFLPHRIQLHQLSYLSFQKGCYKGQEIIARMHYRGTLKHTLQQYIVQTTERLFSGQRILNPQTKLEVGELVDYCPLGEDTFLLAVSIQKENAEVFFEEHSAILRLDSN